MFLLYVTFIAFSGKIRSISWLLCNSGKYFLKIVLILGSIGLYCATKLHVAEKLLLILVFLASSLDIFLTSKNFFLTLLGLQSLAIEYFWYSALRFSNLLSESYIFLIREATPLAMFSMFVFGKQVLGSTYLKLLLALEKMSTEMSLDTLSNLSYTS